MNIHIMVTWLVIGLMLGQTGAALAVPLNQLISGDTLGQGGLTFQNFSASFVFAAGNAAPADTSGIDVQGVSTAGGEHGLRFSGPFTASSTSGQIQDCRGQGRVSPERVA